MWPDTPTLISIIAAVAAVGSMLYAWLAVRTANRTYKVELIGQLYSLYQSPEMLGHMRVVWRIYKQIWVRDSESEEIGFARADNGVPIREDSAIQVFQDFTEGSAEYAAIHHMVTYWTYLALLLKAKSLSPEEVRAFTSPYILGFLVPVTKAYSRRLPEGPCPALEEAYRMLIPKSVRRRQLQLGS